MASSLATDWARLFRGVAALHLERDRLVLKRESGSVQLGSTMRMGSGAEIHLETVTSASLSISGIECAQSTHSVGQAQTPQSSECLGLSKVGNRWNVMQMTPILDPSV